MSIWVGFNQHLLFESIGVVLNKHLLFESIRVRLNKHLLIESIWVGFNKHLFLEASCSQCVLRALTFPAMGWGEVGLSSPSRTSFRVDTPELFRRGTTLTLFTVLQDRHNFLKLRSVLWKKIWSNSAATTTGTSTLFLFYHGESLNDSMTVPLWIWLLWQDRSGFLLRSSDRHRPYTLHGKALFLPQKWCII